MLFTLFIILACREPSQKEWDDFAKCRNSWQYFNVKDSLKGKVLFHKMATIEYGFLSTASLTLIETEEGDTIRVLDLCNTKKDFRTGSFVTLRAQRKPDFSIDIVPFDPKACVFKRTCFGTILKEN
jgi:hypothetical protein